MTKANDKIIDKLQKLLAKANGTANEHEAASFMAKVQQLLTQHQLSMSDLTKNEDPIERTVVMVFPKHGRPWHWDVTCVMAEYYGCKLIRILDRKVYLMTAVGRESSRVTLSLMLPYVLDQLRGLAKEYRAKTGYSMKKSMDDVAAGFWLRVTKIIRSRKRIEEAARATATEQEISDSQALVLMDEAEAALNEMFKNIKLSKANEIEFTELGVAMAERVNLDQQVTNEGKENRLQIADQTAK